MEFHDVLHGVIKIKNASHAELISDLLSCTEIQRLRNMRQMNFDVPLIQELGRSRRLPHSIGVTYIAITIAENSNLSDSKIKELIAASMLHDAAIPPYGHLVETQLNQQSKEGFDHAQFINMLINGNFTDDQNRFSSILHNRIPEVRGILDKHKIATEAVYELISPAPGQASPLAADIDIDNLDNVHRMAIMLGWEDVKENLSNIMEHARITDNGRLTLAKCCVDNISKWLDFRQRIYTLIIAHPECVAHNALQSDLVKLSVESNIISKNNWYITEPEFEERLRHHPDTQDLAWQLIIGCEYHLIDYIWAKNIETTNKLTNNSILESLNNSTKEFLNSLDRKFPKGEYSLFIWYEKRLISRSLNWYTADNTKNDIGSDSHSCLIALVKTTPGGSLKKSETDQWRASSWKELMELVGNDKFSVEYPSDYIGDYFSKDRESGRLF